MSTESVEYLLTVNVADAMSDIRKVEAALMQVLSLARRATGNEDLQEGIILMQRSITVARSLMTAITMLQMSTPFGIIMGLASLATTAYMAQDTFEYARRGL
jgi:hypothetical protein